MRRLTVLLVLLAVLPGVASCGVGDGSSQDSGERRFLLLMHTSLAGSVSSKPDAELVDLGHRACTGLDSGQRSDEVVASLSTDALPGSASFNTYAYLVATAGTELCPNHRSDFGRTIPTDSP